MDRAPKKKKLVIPAAIAVAMLGAAVASAASCSSSQQESSCDKVGGLGGGPANPGDAGCNTGGEAGSGGAIA
jgi:hypothetical protein